MALTDIYRKLFGYDHLQDGTVIDLAEHGRAGADRDGQGQLSTSTFGMIALHTPILNQLIVNLSFAVVSFLYI